MNTPLFLWSRVLLRLAPCSCAPSHLQLVTKSHLDGARKAARVVIIIARWHGHLFSLAIVPEASTPPFSVLFVVARSPFLSGRRVEENRVKTLLPLTVGRYGHNTCIKCGFGTAPVKRMLIFPRVTYSARNSKSLSLLSILLCVSVCPSDRKGEINSFAPMSKHPPKHRLGHVL